MFENLHVILKNIEASSIDFKTTSLNEQVNSKEVITFSEWSHFFICYLAVPWPSLGQ